MRGSIVLASAALAASPAAAKPPSPPTPLFASDTPISVTIRGPMSSLASNRAESPRPATMTVDGVTYPITLTPRGITRKTSDVCEFPPLRVELTRPAPPGSLFDHQRRIKLVTFCKRSPQFQQKVLLEYAAYRLYNLMTPQSFRARLATIDYADDAGRPYISRAGFFLEDFGDVAKRNGMAVAKLPDTVPGSMLDPASSARFAIFEYMISNYDWSMRAGPKGEPCCHNGRLLSGGPGTQLIPVPYDFDWSGLVDAPYAGPPEGIPIQSVRQRNYRGYCAHQAQATAFATQLAARRAEFLGVFSAVPGLDARNQRDAVTFVGRFFDDLQSGRMLKTCIR